MNKTICIALCVILALVAVTTAQTVSFDWVDTYLYRSTDAHNVLRISTTEVNLLGTVTITPDNVKADREKNPVPDNTFWSILPGPVPHAGFGLVTAQTTSGAGAVTTVCTEESTGQRIAQLTWATADATSFTLSAFDSTWYSYYYPVVDKKFGSFVILCPVVAGISDDNVFAAPSSTNIHVAVTNEATLVDIDTSLAMPADGFVSPHIVFKSASLKVLDSKDQISSVKVKAEFTVDKQGKYDFSIVNGPSFSTIDYSTGKQIPLWCSSGSNKHFARIQVSADGSAAVFVPTQPTDKDVIKCEFYLNTDADGGRFVRSERTSITIAAADVLVARTLDLQLTPEYVSASITAGGNGASQDIDVEISTSTPLQSSTPVNVNSTIVFSFSKHIDVSRLSIPTPVDNNPFRGAAFCSDGTDGYLGTVFVDHGANTITLKDVVEVGTADGLICSFTFSGSESFHYINQDKMASVQVAVDGQKLSSLYAPGTWSPLYLESSIAVGLISQDVETNGDVYALTDRFSIQDGYQSKFVTPTEPIVVISLGSTSNQMFNHEDHASQVTCQISSPTNTALSDLKLTFSEETFSWSAPLKDIVDLETYNIVLECKYSRKQYIKYGLEWTPLPQLSVTVVDLVDGKRYLTFNQEKGGVQSITQPTAKPADLPSAKAYHTSISGVYDMATAINYATAQEIANTFGTDVPTFFKDVKASLDATEAQYKDFTLKQVLTPSASGVAAESPYTNFTSAEMMRYFDFKDIGNVFVPIAITTIGEFSRIETSSPAYVGEIAQERVTVSGLFVVESSANPFVAPTAFSAPAPWVNSNVGKKVGLEVLRVSTTNDNTENFWSNQITACGFMDGLQIRQNSDAKYEYDDEDKELSYTTADGNHVLCLNEQSCTVNADCASNFEAGATVCMNSKCTPLPTVHAPFIKYDSSKGKYYDKLFFNAAPSMSSMIAVVVAVVAAFVF